MLTMKMAFSLSFKIKSSMGRIRAKNGMVGVCMTRVLEVIADMPMLFIFIHTVAVSSIA